MPDYIFVYGTLLKGEQNGNLLSESQLVDYIHLKGNLYDTGIGYPSAKIKNTSQNRVFGELYRLPENNKSILSRIDFLESVDTGLFKRKILEKEGKRIHFYEGAEKLNVRKIEHGSWLQYSSLAKNNPSQFAINFEEIHKKNYRKPSEKDIEDQIYIEGVVPVLITSPHSTNHQRMGKLKRYEFYTAAIAEILHAKNRIHVLYSNSLSELDPNYYDESPFKSKVDDIINNDIKFVIDIHGTGKERKEAVYPGSGKERSFTANRTEIVDCLYFFANKHGITVGSEDLFPAHRQDTIAKYCYIRHGVPSIQIEIHRNYREPSRNRENFELLIRFLSDFVKYIQDQIQ